MIVVEIVIVTVVGLIVAAVEAEFFVEVIVEVMMIMVSSTPVMMKLILKRTIDNHLMMERMTEVII